MYTELLSEERAWLVEVRNVLGKTRLAGDIRANHRELATRRAGLVRFLEEPRVPLSNNSAERNLRGPVVGRKNFAGCKSVRGTEVAAVLYTLVESAKLAGVEPRGYLRAAAEAALTEKPPLLPHVYRELLRAKRASVRSATVSLSAGVS